MASDDTAASGSHDEESTSNADRERAGESEGDHPSREELRKRVDELRAELTRLQAQRANAQTPGSWIQRFPLLTIALVLGTGVALGCGLAAAGRSRPERSLSDRGKERLKRLGREASELAERLRKEWSEQAAEEGEQFRKRASEVGKRLAKKARAVGAAARKEADAATERARQAGEDASATVQQATGQTARRVQDAGTAAVEDARASVERTFGRATDGSNGSSRSATRALLTVGAMLAGGYIAAKLGDYV